MFEILTVELEEGTCICLFHVLAYFSLAYFSPWPDHTFVEWRVLTKASTLVYRLHYQEVSLTLYNKTSSVLIL